MSGDERGVQIWYIALDPDAAALGRCLDSLDDAERARRARFASPQLRRRFTVAHAATRQILAGLLDTDPAALRYRLGPWGKPELVDHPTVHHNLTHSGELAVLAVSIDQPVGVDVERLKPVLRARPLAGRYFLPAEARSLALRRPAEQPWWYQRFWTRKEACGKASGVPLVAALTFRVDLPGACAPAPRSAGERYGAHGCRVVDVPAPDGYLAAVAMLGAAPFAVHTRWWQPDADPALLPLARVGVGLGSG